MFYRKFRRCNRRQLLQSTTSCTQTLSESQAVQTLGSKLSCVVYLALMLLGFGLLENEILSIGSLNLLIFDIISGSSVLGIFSAYKISNLRIIIPIIIRDATKNIISVTDRKNIELFKNGVPRRKNMKLEKK